MIQLYLIHLHAISLVGTHGLNRAGSGPTRMGHHKPCVLWVRPIPTRLRTPQGVQGKVRDQPMPHGTKETTCRQRGRG